MAYLIGNTTVITNNGALGSVDGNSLNLANNSNISAGGGSIYASTSSTTKATANFGSSAVIGVGVGGGGGAVGYSGSQPYPPRAGGDGGTFVDIYNTSDGGNIVVSVGGAGNPGQWQGNPGGQSKIDAPSFPGKQASIGGAGNAGQIFPNLPKYSGNPGMALQETSFPGRGSGGNTNPGGQNSASPGWVAMFGI